MCVCGDTLSGLWQHWEQCTQGCCVLSGCRLPRCRRRTAALSCCTQRQQGIHQPQSAFQFHCQCHGSLAVCLSTVSRLTQKSLLTSYDCSHRAAWAAGTMCTKLSKNVFCRSSIFSRWFGHGSSHLQAVKPPVTFVKILCRTDVKSVKSLCVCVCELSSSCWTCTSSEPLHRRTASQVKTAPRRRHRSLSSRTLVSSSSSASSSLRLLFSSQVVPTHYY